MRDLNPAHSNTPRVFEGGRVRHGLSRISQLVPVFITEITDFD